MRVSKVSRVSRVSKARPNIFIIILSAVAFGSVVLPILGFAASLVWHGLNVIHTDPSGVDLHGFEDVDMSGSEEIIYEDRDYNCSDFKTHVEAQKFFESALPGDKHKLDRDGNGLACEGLP
jgi:hypothetical protein